MNIASVMLFSYVSATTINQIIKYKISPDYIMDYKISRKSNTMMSAKKPFEYYNDVIESGFFKIADVSGPEGVSASSAAVEELTLLGTITGPQNIARAMISKKGEQNPKIFALYRVSNDVTNDVYGYKLVGITDKTVYILVGNEKKALELYPKKSAEAGGKSGITEVKGNYIKQTLSRAEIRQKVLNNMDNALNGLRAGPYRVNGQVQGFQLIQIRPFNILYKFGARSGDVVKRINGHSLDSTEKLYQMWESLKSETRVTIDLERNNQVMTFDFNITD